MSLPPTRPSMKGELTGAETLILLVIAIIALGAPILENVMWGPVQGCKIAFAGMGFGCS